jgi:hypothetical protein
VPGSVGSGCGTVRFRGHCPALRALARSANFSIRSERMLVPPWEIVRKLALSKTHSPVGQRQGALI